MSDIVFDRFIRTPFAVQATKITEENMDEIAKLIGEVRTKNDEKYIALDRRIIPNVGRAFVGWYVTILGDNYRCYSPKVFKEQFMEMPAEQPVCFDFSIEDNEEPPVLVQRGEFLTTDPVRLDQI